MVLRLSAENDLARGDLIAASDRPEDTTIFKATIVGLSEQSLRAKSKLKIRYGTSLLQARLVGITSVLDIDTSTEHEAQTVELNDIATVKIQLAQPLPIDLYNAQGRVGSFLLIDPSDGNTLAAGMVSDLNPS